MPVLVHAGETIWVEDDHLLVQRNTGLVDAYPGSRTDERPRRASVAGIQDGPQPPQRRHAQHDNPHCERPPAPSWADQGGGRSRQEEHRDDYRPQGRGAHPIGTAATCRSGQDGRADIEAGHGQPPEDRPGGNSDDGGRGDPQPGPAARWRRCLSIPAHTVIILTGVAQRQGHGRPRRGRLTKRR